MLISMWPGCLAEREGSYTASCYCYILYTFPISPFFSQTPELSWSFQWNFGYVVIEVNLFFYFVSIFLAKKKKSKLEMTREELLEVFRERRNCEEWESTLCQKMLNRACLVALRPPLEVCTNIKWWAMSVVVFSCLDAGTWSDWVFCVCKTEGERYRDITGICVTGKHYSNWL